MSFLFPRASPKWVLHRVETEKSSGNKSQAGTQTFPIQDHQQTPSSTILWTALSAQAIKLSLLSIFGGCSFQKLGLCWLTCHDTEYCLFALEALWDYMKSSIEMKYIIIIIIILFTGKSHWDHVSFAKDPCFTQKHAAENTRYLIQEQKWYHEKYNNTKYNQ